MKVVFFPRNDYSNAVSICNNRWNKQMTYCDCTDGIMEQAAFVPIILWGFRYGIRFGCHLSRYRLNDWHSDMQLIKPLSKVGIIKADLISSIDASTGEYIVRTDYTQSEYNNYVAAEDSWFLENIGYTPGVTAYLGSNTSYRNLTQQKMIAGRGDVPGTTEHPYEDFGNPYTWNGLSFPQKIAVGSPNVPFVRADQTIHKLSCRWFDALKDSEYSSASQVIALVKSDISITKQNGGFYGNFEHWHQMIGNHSVIYEPPYLGKITFNDIESYYQNIADGDIHFCSWGEAMEYAIARTMIKRIAIYSPIQNPDTVSIVVEFTNDYDVPVPIERFKTPLSAVVDLSNTPLSGKYIKLNKGNFIKLSNDRYIIDIPCPTHGLMTRVTISEAQSDLSLPTTSPILAFDGTTATSTQNVNMVVFKRPANATDDKDVTIDSFAYNTTSTSISRNAAYKYAIGAINGYNKTALTEWV